MLVGCGMNKGATLNQGRPPAGLFVQQLSRLSWRVRVLFSLDPRNIHHLIKIDISVRHMRSFRFAHLTASEHQWAGHQLLNGVSNKNTRVFSLSMCPPESKKTISLLCLIIRWTRFINGVQTAMTIALLLSVIAIKFSSVLSWQLSEATMDCISVFNVSTCCFIAGNWTSTGP